MPPDERPGEWAVILTSPALGPAAGHYLIPPRAHRLLQDGNRGAWTVFLARIDRDYRHAMEGR